MDLIIRVKEIRGNCPVYKINDSFKLENGYRLVSKIPICMHSLTSLLPYYNVLKVSEPGKWGLAGVEDKTKSYLQCLDPYEYTGSGTVIFEVSRVEQ